MNLLLKILLSSFAISVAICQLGPSLGIAATDLNATIAILVPAMAVALFLTVRGWRAMQ